MEYLSAKETAAKWNVTPRQVQRLLHEGRISGAKKYGVAWMIPEDAPKPQDPRRARQAQPIFHTLPRQCPQLVMTTLLSVPGSGDLVTASLAADAEAQTLFAAQLAYFRCENERAKALAEGLIRHTSRPDVLLGSGFVQCLAAMYDGDAGAWARGRAIMAKVPCATAVQEALRDFQLGNVDSGLYDQNGFPAWFRQGNFDPLPADCYPLARLLFLKYLMLSKGDPSISFICGPLISQSRMEGALLSEIYCRVLTAIGLHDRGLIDLATEQIDAAIALALPDRLLSPLVEYRNELGLLLDERLTAVDRAAAATVRELHRRLMTGWAVLYQKIRGMVYVTSLTAREHHAAKLAAKGLGNTEIAARMGLSVNSVKRYISQAIAKTGAAGRAELAEFIALEGITLP